MHNIVESFSIIRWNRKSEPSSACGRRNWMTSPRRLNAAPRRRPARSSPDHCKRVRRGAGRSDDAVTRNRRCIYGVYPQKPGVTRLKTPPNARAMRPRSLCRKNRQGLAVGSAPIGQCARRSPRRAGGRKSRSAYRRYLCSIAFISATRCSSKISSTETMRLSTLWMPPSARISANTCRIAVTAARTA